MGRPKKVTDKQIIEALWAANGFLTHAAQILNIHYSSLSERISKNPKLAQAQNDIIESRLDIAENQLHKLIDKGNFAAIRFFLKSKGRCRGYGQQRVGTEKMIEPESGNQSDELPEELANLILDPRGAMENLRLIKKLKES